MGNQKFKCLIDTGSETSIIKPQILQNFSETKLSNPLYYSTINGINKVDREIVTPLPKEFLTKGSISWKVIALNGRKYDAIIGQNLLTAIKAVVNIDKRQLETNKNIILFEDDCPYEINEITTPEISKGKIIENLKVDHLNKEEYNSIINLLKNYQELFFKEGDKLSFTHEIQHDITTTTSNPIYSKIYRYPQIHEKEIEKQISEMLSQGIIKESNSPYNSPLWIVPKKADNSGKQKWRIVIDYRKLNEVTVSDKFPIPNIDNILEKLGKAQYFTTLDLAKGFHQILVKPEDRRKTAFSTPFGHYEYIRMPFGLKNAPSTFQRLMNSILRDYINKICVVYLDDILIFSTSLEEHILSIRKIFERLREAKLKIQVDKCNFLRKETEYLGHILTPEGVRPNPTKIEVIQNLKLPTTQKQIKSFLGITGYYRKFIKNYAKIAQPLTKYLKKNTKVNPNDPCYIAAFEKLKDLITNHPILRYPDFNKKFKIITDASNYAIGAVLTQDSHPICYASRTLNNHEQNYSTIEKELLAVVWGVRYFRPYLFGREFELQTDHQPIKWLHAKHNGKDINPRLQRWLIQLGEYNIKFEYIKGKENKIADFLSRINTKTQEINTSETLNQEKIKEGNMIGTIIDPERENGHNKHLNKQKSRTSTENLGTNSENNNFIEQKFNTGTENLGTNSLTDHFFEYNLNTSTENLGTECILENSNDSFSGIMNKKIEKVNNLEEDDDERGESIEVLTIHSQEENSEDHIPILETVVNRFKLQIIFVEAKEKEFETIFKNRRIFIDKNDLVSNNVNDILKRYLSTKCKIGIYTNLSDHEFNELQQKLITLYPTRSALKFVKCSYFATDIEDEEKLRKQIALFHKNEVGHSGIIPTYEGMKKKIYHPNLKTEIWRIINNCEICSCAKYDRNPIKKKFCLSETPSATNEIVHVDVYVNSKHSFIIFIDKFSKFATTFYLEDRNSLTIVEKLKQFISMQGKIQKFTFDNEFKSKNVEEFLKKEGIDYHITKPNNHTGNADVERLNNTLTERIRALNLEDKQPIKLQILNAITFYNNSYHSTIKCTPFEVQNREVKLDIIKQRIDKKKNQTIAKVNKNREDYEEIRTTGFIKNYKSLRHKEEPKFRKHKLSNIHENNIKRPFKFLGQNTENRNHVDAGPSHDPLNSSNTDN